jgi:hypothetical protein
MKKTISHLLVITLWLSAMSYPVAPVATAQEGIRPTRPEQVLTTSEDSSTAQSSETEGENLSGVSASQSLQEGRDYFLPGELSPDAGRVISVTPETDASAFPESGSASASYPTQETIQYISLSGVTYTLRAFSGKYVRWAFQDSSLGANGLSQSEIKQLVSLTDLAYFHMSELIGGEPFGNGLLTIALVDAGGYAGLGLIGIKGVDISPFMLNDIKRYLAVGQLHGVILHEMSHNFDIYSYLGYYGDFGHAWTHFLQHFVLLYASFGDYDLTPEAALTWHTKRTTKAWDAAGSQVSWGTCVRGGVGCLGIHPNDGWSGFMLRFARLHGPAAMKRAFAYLRDNRNQNNPFPVTPEDKNDLLVKALAYGAHANILCEIDTWNWDASPVARSAINGLYHTQSAFCQDIDADGYSPAEGDYNDRNRNVHPGAVETQNGVDDDCDDIIDDVAVAEPDNGDFPYPQELTSPTGRISGRITTGDSDSFTINITQPRKVTFELCSTTDFQGWIFVYKSDGSWFDYQYVGANSCSTKTYQLNEVRQWRFDVALSSNPAPGKYSVRYHTLDPWPVSWGTPAPASTNGNGYRFAVNMNTLANANARPTHVRFWVDGLGFVGSVPYAPTTIFDWISPAGFTPGTNTYRAQPLSGTVPAEAATLPQAFGTGASISPESKSFESSGGAGTIQVTAPGGLYWSATSNAAWITITAGMNGFGNASVKYSVVAHTGTTARTGALTVAGKTFTVNQAAPPAASEFTISGKISVGSTTPGMDGVTVKLTSPIPAGFADRTFTTDSTGTYSFTGLPAGRTYKVTPAKAGHAFTPSVRSYSNLSANQTAANFSAVQTYSISGRVTGTGTTTGVGTVRMTITSPTPTGFAARAVLTNSLGNYTFTNLPAGRSYTITPTKSGFTFSPATKSITNLSNNVPSGTSTSFTGTGP